MGEARPHRVKVAWAAGLIVILVVACLAVLWGYRITGTLSNLSDKVEGNKAAIEGNREEIGKLRGEVSSNAKEIEALKGELKGVAGSVEKEVLRKVRSMVETKVRSALENVTEAVDSKLSALNSTLSGRVEELGRSLEGLKGSVRTLEERSKRLEGRVAGLEGGLDKLKANVTATLVSLGSELRELDRTLAAYRSALLKISSMASSGLKELKVVRPLAGNVTDKSARKVLLALINVTARLLEGINETAGAVLTASPAAKYSFAVDELVNVHANLTGALVSVNGIKRDLSRGTLDKDTLESIYSQLDAIKRYINAAEEILGLRGLAGTG